MKYAKYINFNFNASKGMNYSNAKKIWKHVDNNKERTYGQELIRKEPEIEDIIYTNCSEEEFDKSYYEEWEKLPQKNNKSNPYRCWVLQFNLEPTKENLKIIESVMKKVNNFFEEFTNPLMSKVHNNEKRVGIHVISKNWYNGKIGNFNKKGELKKLNGYFAINKKTGEKVDIQSRNLKQFKLEHPDWEIKDYGKELFKEMWLKGQELIKQECERFGLEFKQEPVTDKGLARKYNNIENFREWKEWLKDDDEKEEKNIWKEKAEKLEKENKSLKTDKKVLETKNKNLIDENIKKEKQINNLVQKDEKINDLENEIKEYKNTDQKYETYKFGNLIKRAMMNKKVPGETPEKQFANLINYVDYANEKIEKLEKKLQLKNDYNFNQLNKHNQKEK